MGLSQLSPLLNFRLDKFIKKHNLIHLTQIGFTKDARTSYHLNTVTQRGNSMFVDFY